MNKQAKLIIWDFDGVISDTEQLWIKNWQVLLKKYFNIDWDFNQANKILGGLSPKSKIENLQRLGIKIEPEFLAELKELDWQAMSDMKAVDNVEKIFNMHEYAHCIASGGNLDKTLKKLEVLDFKKYFPNNHIFTAQQVENGKPEPDLFLLAAAKMGFDNKNCIVIEDSLAGLQAGLNANMATIAFLGCPMNNNQKHLKGVKDLKIQHIFYNMSDVYEFLKANTSD